MYADGHAEGVNYTSTTIYKVTYDANGATSGSAPDTQAKFENQSMAIAGNWKNLEKNGVYFNGWNTQANGKGTHYDVGQSFTTDASMTLYAEWTDDPATAPTITETSEDLEFVYGQSETIHVEATQPENHTLTYQWYYSITGDPTDGKSRPIDGATSSSYTIAARERGTGTYYYYCIVTSQKDGTSSKATATSRVVNAAVTPKPVTITANDAEKTYDGDALTNGGFTIVKTAQALRMISLLLLQ